ncbi:hypothetical protein D9M68_798890 [compost metagenome]
MHGHLAEYAAVLGRDSGLVVTAGELVLTVELHDLVHGEEADHDRDEVDPTHQIRHVEGETRCAGDQVEAHGSQQQADHQRQKALDRRTLGNEHRAAQAEDRQPEVFVRAEVEGEFGQ